MRKIHLPQNFRPGSFDPTGTHTMMYSPGVYRVPEDMSKEHAERSISEANARWEDDDEPATKKKMKGEAPENKLR